MKKTEKILLAACMLVLGVLLIVFQERVIKIAVSILGLSLIALGIVDFFNKTLLRAFVKGVAGLIVLLFGIFAVRAVLYLIAGGLLIIGVLLLQDRLKNYRGCNTLFQKILAYALPAVCLFIGVLLLFISGEKVGWVFVVSGIFIVVESGLLVVESFVSD